MNLKKLALWNWRAATLPFFLRIIFPFYARTPVFAS